MLLDLVTVSKLMLGLTVTVLTYWLWQQRHVLTFALTYPYTVFGVPPIGAFAYMGSVRSMLPFLKKQWQRFTDRTMCIWMGLTPCLFIADYDVVEQVLTMPEFSAKSRLVYGPVHDVLDGGLVAETPARAAQLRKYFAPAFRHKNLLGLIPLMNARSKRFVRELELKSNGDAMMLHLLHDLHVFTLGMSKRTIMGYTKDEDNDDFTTIMSRLKYTFHQMKYEISLNCIHLRKLIQYNPTFAYVRAKLDAYCDEMLTHRIEYLRSEQMQPKNASHGKALARSKKPFLFIDQVYKHYKNGQLKWMDLMSEANGLLVASYETSSTLFSTLLLLAIHRDVQERLYDEIANVFPPHQSNADIFVDYASLQQLPYLDMVLNEVLRIFPAVPMIARQCAAPGVLNINGRYHKVPRGMQILIDIFHLHRDKRVWGDDANNFNPDHFLPSNARIERPAYAFIPFSRGPRNCMGWAYANFVIKVLLVHILRAYKLRTDQKFEDINVTMSLFLEHNASVCLHLQRRKETNL